MSVLVKGDVLFNASEIYLIIKILDENLPTGYTKTVQKLNKLLHENKKVLPSSILTSKNSVYQWIEVYGKLYHQPLKDKKDSLNLKTKI